MRHVFAETNWVVDCFAPRPHRTPDAVSLLQRARQGELVLHVPSICLTEASDVIRRRFKPRSPDWHRFRQQSLEQGRLTPEQNEALLRFFEVFQATVLQDLAALDEALDALRHTPGVELFALDQTMLERAISLRPLGLKPFDEAILAAVLVRAELLHAAGAAELIFCTIDGDLRPDKQKDRRLSELYVQAGLRVLRNFLPFVSMQA